MSHPVVWFEVVGNDGGALQSFYARLFQWKIDAANPAKYGLVDAASDRGIPGGIGGEMGEKAHSGVTFYVSTDDITRSLAEAVALGGKILMPRTVLPGGTILGMLADPSGNAVGLIEDGGA